MLIPGNEFPDADVKLTVYAPDSNSTSATDETDNDGQAKFKVKINDDAETGEFDVKVRVSKDGYDTNTVNTSFDVISTHHQNNNDNDENNDGNSSSSAASAAAATSDGSSSAASSAASGGSSAAVVAAAAD